MTCWKQMVALGVVVVVAMMRPGLAAGAQLILPQDRRAYYTEEPIKLAVAGLAQGAAARIAFVPKAAKLAPLSLAVQGHGATVIVVLPPGSLAPGSYSVQLDGREAAQVAVASGVRASSSLISQTTGVDQLRQSGGNFVVGSAFSFGRLSDGKPVVKNLRDTRSGGFVIFEQAIAANVPTIVYMYWTGYCVHKPFGGQISWAAADVQYALRLLNFHVAQRLRRFARNIIDVGTLDEPGLTWGKTPAGGMASGFPNHDERDWYEARGWRFRDDPSSGDDADWMKYMHIRCAILGETNRQASRDIKTVWPKAVFSTDIYAPGALMDGADPLNQEVNDFPSTHVFADWGIDRLGLYSGLMLEKAANPTAKVAHAMNGQLFGRQVPQPGQKNAYRACLNGLLAAGLASNWWLNWGAMKPEELAAVNEPAQRIGPVLGAMTCADHDVAVLWSFTEVSMREKQMAAREAHKKTGEQIKLMVAAMPENAVRRSGEIDINAYSISGDYRDSVLTAHYALARAGYPAQIVHESLLPRGILKKYRTLVIVGQTFDLPRDVVQAIDAFAAAGGKIVVDRSCTVAFPHPIVAQADLKGVMYRWVAPFVEKPENFKTPRDASYYQTNRFMTEAVRGAVAPLRTAMRQTDSRARAESDSNELLFERHVGGDGQLFSVANGYEKLPEIAGSDTYFIYNCAPYSATFRLRGLADHCAAYVIQGTDWSQTARIADPAAPIRGDFQAAEMKLYLVVPHAPAGLDVSAAAAQSAIDLRAALQGLKSPWPLSVAIKNPAGDVIYHVWRSTTADGSYSESFPLGTNAASGEYAVNVTSPLGNLAKTVPVRVELKPAVPRIVAEAVQVFDGPTIRKFFAGKPAVVVAVGSPSHQAAAEKLAAALVARGISATVQPETAVLKKARYPRVWNPYVKVYHATHKAPDLAGRKVERRITLSVDAAGGVHAATSDGKELPGDWRQPGALVTIAGDGYLDWSGDDEIAYEPGVVLHLEPQGKVAVVAGLATEEKATAELKARWSKPWTKLTSHVGGYQLPPQLPEAYTTDAHLILLGDGASSQAVAALQASDLLLEIADAAYPGPGKALVSFAWSPFAVEKNVILVGAADGTGLAAGIDKLLELAR